MLLILLVLSSLSFGQEDSRSVAYKKMDETELYARLDSTDTLAIAEIERRSNRSSLPALLRVEGRWKERQKNLTDKGIASSPFPVKKRTSASELREQRELFNLNRGLERLRHAKAVMGDANALKEYESDLGSNDSSRIVTSLNVLKGTGDRRYVGKILPLLESKGAVGNVGLSVYAMEALKVLLPNVNAGIHGPGKNIYPREELVEWKKWREAHKGEFK
jgi:hypothetical protein